ncbi:MAG TPA: hypothetical protein VMW45_04490 [Dehalococcoidia bacterium]|nr:hypothetical protein [Dehalococcoidia bacterium]
MNEDELEDKDFRKMWERLEEEVSGLKRRDVLTVNTNILGDYMFYIRRVAEHERTIELLEAKLKIAGVS